MVWLALRNALRAARTLGEAIRDGVGVGVRIDRATLYQPDALVRLGSIVSSDTRIIDDPVIIVEVVSPSTRSIDTGVKLAGYSHLLSVRHYLVVDGETREVIHHRKDEGTIVTRIVSAGSIDLEPPVSRLRSTTSSATDHLRPRPLSRRSSRSRWRLRARKASWRRPPP